jgi:DNA-binding CsgD family transcriptional regulator
MRETERFSSLIGDIYDAVLDPARWPGALGKVRDFVGGQAAVLCHKDAASRCGCADYQDGGLDPRYVQLYFDKYIRFDPFSTGQFFAEIGQPVAIADLIPPEEILETRFYTEWVRPQGLVDCLVSPLDKSATSAALVGVFRHERHGPADDETRRRLRLVVPHLRRAVLIGKVIDLKAIQAAALGDTLDAIPAAILLVDARGRIVHANASGHALLAQGSTLRAAGGKLAAGYASAEQALHEVFLAAGSGDARVGSKGIAVPLPGRDGEGYVAHVLPLTSGARRRAGTAYAAVAAVFVQKAGLDTRSPLEAIAKHYKLTPSELRVLVAVVEIGGVRETAEALGLSEATVKTHLNHLFNKTGTSRQADLVKLIAGFESPLLRWEHGAA